MHQHMLICKSGCRFDNLDCMLAKKVTILKT